MATNNGYFFALTYAWEFAKLGGMNQGVISTLVSFASVFNIIAFYFLYNEKISCTQFMGVLLLIGCAMCLVFEAGSKKSEVSEVDMEIDGEIVEDSNGLSERTNAFFAILCGFLGPILMSTKHAFIRKYKNQLGYGGFSQATDSNVIEYLILCFFLIPLASTFDYTFKDLLIGAVAGILASLGRVFIAIGVADGLAGPAQACMSTHAIHQTLWTTFVGGQDLSFMQILGLCLGFTGVITLSLIDELIKKRQRSKEQEKKKVEDEKAAE